MPPRDYGRNVARGRGEKQSGVETLSPETHFLIYIYCQMYLNIYVYIYIKLYYILPIGYIRIRYCVYKHSGYDCITGCRRFAAVYTSAHSNVLITIRKVYSAVYTPSATFHGLNGVPRVILLFYTDGGVRWFVCRAPFSERLSTGFVEIALRRLAVPPPTGTNGYRRRALYRYNDVLECATEVILGG